MAVLRAKEIEKMSEKERKEKLKELRLELVRAGNRGDKASGKTKEIKKAIARIITLNKRLRRKNNG
ncbi:50S ribosomal protein L29 [Candidatus Pacearchaeota archaeon]|nr:MAG: 50S ribosomal protein L29 [Candidatus Pacearchaeota archaeon]